jgi:transcriptional regulator NrdR family protein
MGMEQVIVMKKDKSVEAFNQNILEESVREAFSLSGKERTHEEIAMLTEEVVRKLQTIGNELYGEDIHYAVIDILEENGHEEAALLYKQRKNDASR